MPLVSFSRGTLQIPFLPVMHSREFPQGGVRKQHDIRVRLHDPIVLHPSALVVDVVQGEQVAEVTNVLISLPKLALR